MHSMTKFLVNIMIYLYFLIELLKVDTISQYNLCNKYKNLKIKIIYNCIFFINMIEL